jgi:hypothetical protein
VAIRSWLRLFFVATSLRQNGFSLAFIFSSRVLDTIEALCLVNTKATANPGTIAEELSISPICTETANHKPNKGKIQ